METSCILIFFRYVGLLFAEILASMSQEMMLLEQRRLSETQLPSYSVFYDILEFHLIDNLQIYVKKKLYPQNNICHDK